MPVLRATAAGLIGLILASGAGRGPAPEPAERPTPRAHAHNDYHHEHPLFDALHHGFVGVEADVFLVGDELRVSHDKVQDWSTVPTLQNAYLTPLSELKTRRRGFIYPRSPAPLLMIDIKSAAAPTYRRIHEVLDEYEMANPGLFTVYAKVAHGKYAVKRGAVDVLITGDRPREVMAAQDVRLAAYDGRLPDLGPDVNPDDAPEFVPVISDNWEKVFTRELAWDGVGDIPPATRTRLREIVAQAHGEGKRIRFWKTPKDTPVVWKALYDAGVDLINTDDLDGLASYVRSRQPPPK
jgi:glycerophosphoryl diester phosphodiesterase